VIGAEQRVEKERCDKGLTTSNNNKIKRIRHVNSSPRFKATRLQRMDSELQKGPNINTFYTTPPRPAPTPFSSTTTINKLMHSADASSVLSKLHAIHIAGDQGPRTKITEPIPEVRRREI
jgi:hypothetical protein